VFILQQEIKRFLFLGHQGGDVEQAVSVKIGNGRANGAGTREQDVFAVLVVAQVLEPGKAPDGVAKFAQNEIKFAVSVEIGELGMSRRGRSRSRKRGGLKWSSSRSSNATAPIGLSTQKSADHRHE